MLLISWFDNIRSLCHLCGLRVKSLFFQSSAAMVWRRHGLCDRNNPIMADKASVVVLPVRW